MDSIASLTDQYALTLCATAFMLATVVAQQIIATFAHRAQDNAVPGKVSDQLGHDSFVFRSHRTFMNSLENIPHMFGFIVLAMLLQVDAQALAIITWVYAAARLMHMVLYYAIATDKNPSPRSHFFAIAFLAELTLIGYVIAALV